jgi:chromosome segregation ATPase
VPWWTWLALGAFALALVAAAIFAVNAIGQLRRAQAVAAGLQGRLDELARAAEELDRRTAAAQGRAEELERERARLTVSFERLSVLTWALSDARKGVTRLRKAYLRK